MGFPSKLVVLNKQMTAIRNSGSEVKLPVIHSFSQNRMVKLRLVHGSSNNRPLGASAFPFVNTW